MKKFQPNKRENANIFSFCTFWWMNSFFANGAKNTLQEEDMMELSKKDTSEVVCNKLERNWKRELEKLKNGGKPSLGKAIVRTYWFFFLKIGIFSLFEEGPRIAVPILISQLIQYFENMESQPISEAYIRAAAISVISLFFAVYHHLLFYYIQRLGWHIRAAACAMMYKKTLRLSQKSLSQTTTGQIVNLGATDVIRFDVLPLFMHYLWLGPLQAVVCAYLLWDTVGPSVLSGIGVLFVIMIIQSLNGKAFGALRMKTAVITDERVRLMNEVIIGMRIIKMYTWEKPFAEVVAALRKKEVRKIMWTAILRAFNLTMFNCGPKVISCVTFIVFVSYGGELTASQVFKVIGMYNVIRISLGLFFPIAVEKIAESAISIKRIETFLLLDEIKPTNHLNSAEKENLPEAFENDSLLKKENGEAHEPVQNEKELSGKSFIEMKDFCGKWYSSSDDDSKATPTMTLKNINVRVEAGQLLAVIGPVGSGKSSFLSAILGELPRSSGQIEINGELTFANQVPWVFAGTIRENILFGESYDEDWFKKVVKACGLERDLDLFPNGDFTLVGERGVTLSGGQKARVNLARAAYRRNATICLLDDPLSAVDTAVGNHIFQECISGIMKDKVRILVTHQLQLLQDADQIIILKEGEIVGHGTYDELQADGTDFASLLQEREDDEEEEIYSDVEDEAKVLIRQHSKSPSKKLGSMSASNKSLKSILSEESMNLINAESPEQNEYKTEEIKEEMRSQGSVGRSVYYEYFHVGAGKLFGFLFCIIILISHVVVILCDWWISIWATKYEEHKRATLNIENLTDTAGWDNATATPLNSTRYSMQDVDKFNSNYYLTVYGVFTLSAIFTILIRAIMHFYICITSGIHMHNKMFRAILRAPIRFFDTNPSGRILNRFSKDIGQIDDLLPLAFFDFLYIFGVIISIMILAVVINYIVIIIVLPLVAIFFWLRQYYLKTSRDIKRLEGSTRSPVFGLLSSTLQGLSTVRAFKVQDEFEAKFHERQDLHSCAWYLFLCGGRWLACRLDFLSAIFITTVTFTSLLTLPFIPLTPGQVGLTLTYSVTLLGMFQWGVRQSTEVENLMTSVERVQQYYSIPPEAPDEKPDEKPHPDWPTHGVVTFDRVSFAYYDGGPNVLNKVLFNIKAQEKVGIVGRTGAGKSSLISALFRLAELTGGEILIDGIPISPLGLNDLRRALSIIPQDPILFTGTMRRNLDPFSQYSDEDLWDSLEQVQLKEVVDALPLKLDTELAESGSNFSVGQRQLVCLARAVLRKCKILVIDEATANVDLRTDRLIQLTIRDKFKHCTVLTIAHRINTIIDSDRVMVLDAGYVKEFDDPHILLQNKESYFSKLVDMTKANEAESLRKMAEEAHKARIQPGFSVPDNVRDKDRSYLSRFVPTPGTYDEIEFETGV